MAYCVAEDLLSAFLAAEEILLRYRLLGNAWMNGVDLKSVDPVRYARIATGPIERALVGLPSVEDEDDSELLPIFQ